ncbi:hypothetical protein Hanom_Chr04g00332041 [Helianthus anomalus]
MVCNDVQNHDIPKEKQNYKIDSEILWIERIRRDLRAQSWRTRYIFKIFRIYTTGPLIY